jgi:hypothetical protein
MHGPEVVRIVKIQWFLEKISSIFFANETSVNPSHKLLFWAVKFLFGFNFYQWNQNARSFLDSDSGSGYPRASEVL